MKGMSAFVFSAAVRFVISAVACRESSQFIAFDSFFRPIRWDKAKRKIGRERLTSSLSYGDG